MASGGYHPPAQPAAVSGPGALSQRTDGRPQPVRDLPGGQYGSGKDFREIQQGSPLASVGKPASASGGGAAADPLAAMAGFSDPTSMPDTPVTDGADAGDGAGSDALGIPPANALRSELAKIGKYLPVMVRLADSDDATPAFRQYVRYLLGGA